MGPARAPCGAVRILPPRAGHVEYFCQSITPWHHIQQHRTEHVGPHIEVISQICGCLRLEIPFKNRQIHIFAPTIFLWIAR